MTVEKRHWVISARGKNLFLPFEQKSTVYWDDYRIINPHEPPRFWKPNYRVCPTAKYAEPLLLFPDCVEEAYYLLSREIHVCGLVFDDEPVDRPWPLGPVWVNLSDGKKSWASHMALLTYDCAGKTGVLGHLTQDGCKFSSGYSLNLRSTVQGVILKKRWIPYLQELLHCLVVKNEAWHNGQGVHC
jgi:hypothetical protein